MFAKYDATIKRYIVTITIKHGCKCYNISETGYTLKEALINALAIITDKAIHESEVQHDY